MESKISAALRKAYNLKGEGIEYIEREFYGWMKENKFTISSEAEIEQYIKKFKR